MNGTSSCGMLLKSSESITASQLEIIIHGVFDDSYSVNGSCQE
jgi:hypothetical protein